MEKGGIMVTNRPFHKEITYEEYQRSWLYYKTNYIIVKSYEKPSPWTFSGKKLWVLLKERNK